MRSIVPFLLMSCLASYAFGGEVQDETNARLTAPKALRDWVDARAGTGDPVHWIADGGVYAYPSGEKLFGMVGFDSSTVIWPEESGDDVVHLTRKTFAYTDPITVKFLRSMTAFQSSPSPIPTS